MKKVNTSPKIEIFVRFLAGIRKHLESPSNE
jgi:hypothetical protein